MTRDEQIEKMANEVLRVIRELGILEIEDDKERANAILEVFSIAMGKAAMIEPEFMNLLKRNGLN